MIYSVIKELYLFNLGREYSAVNRQKALNKLNIEGKILTKCYNTYQSYLAMQFNLNPDQDVLNMYDYFLGFTHEDDHHKWHIVNVRECSEMNLNKYVVHVKDDCYEYTQNGHLKFKAYCNPYILNNTVLGRIECFDKVGRLMFTQRYDYRGYPTSIDYYGVNGNLLSRDYLDINGNVKIETQYMKVNNEIVESYIWLYNFRGNNYLFKNEDELFNFFINMVEIDQAGNLIVDDINLARQLDKTVQLPNNVKYLKYLYLHGSHVMPNKDGTHSLSPIFKDFLLNDAQYYNGILVDNKLQANSINEYLNGNDGIKVLNDNVIFESTLALPIKINKDNDQPITIGYFGNVMDNSKNIKELINIFGKIKINSKRKVQFRIYALLNQDTQADIQKWMDKNNLTKDDVKIIQPMIYGFTHEIYHNVDIVVTTSINEGGSMMVTDALGLGKPIVAYDSMFGNHYHLTNNKNALLVQPHNIDEFVNKTVKLIGDHTLQNKLSQNAKQYAKKYLNVHYFENQLNHDKLN